MQDAANVAVINQRANQPNNMPEDWIPRQGTKRTSRIYVPGVMLSMNRTKDNKVQMTKNSALECLKFKMYEVSTGMHV